jgi:hypothetical protein
MRLSLINDQRLITNVQFLHRATLITVKDVIPAKAEILMIQFILHWQFLLKPEIEFKIIEPWDRWFYPL